jgi:hypothetical protein
MEYKGSRPLNLKKIKMCVGFYIVRDPHTFADVLNRFHPLPLFVCQVCRLSLLHREKKDKRKDGRYTG